MIALRVQDPAARHEEAFDTGWRRSHPETKLSTKAPSAAQLNPLRGFRAMLFPDARLFRPEAKQSPKASSVSS
jgi:hypothetical protein